MAFSLRKVLISDEIDSKCMDILQKHKIEVVKNTKLTKEQLVAEIEKYDGIIVRSATKVTAEVIEAATNLKIIGRAGTGVDNIDCNAATKKGIIVMNTPGGNTLSAAELTCIMICSLSRELPQACQSMKEGRWDRKKFMGNELYGKTLGIIGLGRIGKEVALRMQSFGMTTIGFDPIISAEESAEFGVEWMQLNELWPLIDYVTVHTPLIPQTKHLINGKVFDLCKRGVKVINCARGGIIDELALKAALDSGQCGGAGLDVYVDEPPKDFSLVQHPKVIATPHLGASTVEAQSRVGVEIAEQFVDLAEGRQLFGAINASALVNALSPESQPWVVLGQRLGTVAAAIIDSVNAVTEVSLTSYGTCLKTSGSFLAAAVLSGLLRNSTMLNLVNAPALGREMGIKVNNRHEDGDKPWINLQLHTREGPVAHVSGVTAGIPLLIAVNGATFSSPASLHGHSILFRSQPSPQIIPQVINSVTESGVSIQGLSAAATGSGEMWGVVNVAKPIKDLSALKALTSWVTAVSF